MFHKVLIANRGEIAIRVAKACRELGVKSVAVYSDADADAPHVHACDEAVHVGKSPSRESYLKIEHIIQAGLSVGADAIHPGYGFLSENAHFARAIGDAGMVLIGPSPSAIAAMGDKTEARSLVRTVGVPVTPAIEAPPSDVRELEEQALRVGFPLLVKAAAGGGGRGMRIVREMGELGEALESATREAASAFGDGRVFIERYVEYPRHIEMQILADRYGNVVHFGERECSLQRRHQKVIEEAPSANVDEALRARLAAAAIAAARCVAYVNAGTVEFMVDKHRNIYFLEMNTRIQVEHPVTEWVYGVDLVQAQIRIAAGEPLWIRQEDVKPRGHAIEARIYAEDPFQGFRPAPGRIENLVEPRGLGIRVDSGVRSGWQIPLYYDSMISKLSVWAGDRESARRRMLAALRDYRVDGVTTNIPFLISLLSHPDYITNNVSTGWLGDNLPQVLEAAGAAPTAE
jgi:acetyl-CoA carboxylase biotin carboxylase subunit